MPASTAVLDSYALLAFFRGEPPGGKVRDLLDSAAMADQPLHMTEVNYAEVKYILLKKDGAGAWRQAEEVLQSLPIEFHSADRRLSDLAAEFKARLSLSLADAYAAALARERKAELVTGDREFELVESEVQIHWLKSTGS